MLAYQRPHPKLSISGLTVFELLDGLYRNGDQLAIREFHSFLLPSYEVIRPTAQIEDKTAENNAALAKARKSIGVVDTFIAATAIIQNLTLVNANKRHFSRLNAEGFSLGIENWREQ